MYRRASNSADAAAAVAPPIDGVRGFSRPRTAHISRSSTAQLLAAIIAVAFGLYLLGNDRVSLWDRDEPRYAQCSRQMLQSGDWVVPRLLDKWRTEKPPLIYWCQLTAMSALGDTVFAARLPSAVAMALTLALLAVCLFRYVGPARALGTVVIVATAGLVWWSAKTCLTDTVLLLFVTIAQLCLYAIYRGRSTWPVVLTMWVAIALAVLTKGPYVLGVLLFTMVALAMFDYAPPTADSRRWPARVLARFFVGIARAAKTWWLRTRPLLGVLILVALVGPWAWLLERRAPGFLAALLSIGARHLEAGTNHHTGPPGYHAAFIWATFFPWSLLIPTGLAVGWRHRRVPALRFALASVLGIWVMVELVQTKLPHYFLPAFAPLAFLIADALLRCARGQHDDLTKPAAWVMVGVWACVAATVGLCPWLLLLLPKFQAFHPFARAAGYAMVALSLVAGTWALTTYHCFRTQRLGRATAAMALGMTAMMAIAYNALLPNLPFLRVSERVADALIRDGADARITPGDARMVDYKETSVAFYQGGTIRPDRDDLYLEKTPPDQWPHWLVITRALWNRTPEAIRTQWAALEHGEVKGVNVADHGNTVDVLTLRRKLATDGHR